MKIASYFLTAISGLLGLWAISALVAHFNLFNDAQASSNTVAENIDGLFILWDLAWLAVWTTLFAVSFWMRRKASNP
jgi:hypothetical protein